MAWKTGLSSGGPNHCAFNLDFGAHTFPERDQQLSRQRHDRRLAPLRANDDETNAPWSLPLRAEVTSSHGHAAHPLRKDSCRWLRNRGRPCVPGMGTGLEVKVLRGARW